jgi:hypothetical protein
LVVGPVLLSALSASAAGRQVAALAALSASAASAAGRQVPALSLPVPVGQCGGPLQPLPFAPHYGWPARPSR